MKGREVSADLLQFHPQQHLHLNRLIREGQLNACIGPQDHSSYNSRLWRFEHATSDPTKSRLFVLFVVKRVGLTGTALLLCRTSVLWFFKKVLDPSSQHPKHSLLLLAFKDDL